ncbi:MAG: hypothetical protein VCC04_01490, partial [Myxococcota bacterium]
MKQPRDENGSAQRSSAETTSPAGTKLESRWFTQPLGGVFSQSDQRRVLDIVSLGAAAALILEFAYIFITGKSVGGVMQAGFWLGLGG